MATMGALAGKQASGLAAACGRTPSKVPGVYELTVSGYLYTVSAER